MSARARKRRRMRRTTPDLLMQYIWGRSAGAAERLPCHWIHGSGEIAGSACDEAKSFCPPCANKKVGEVFAAHPREARRVGLCVDGGWSSDHDGPEFCETCGAKLDGSLTDYGFEWELDALTTYAAPMWGDGPGAWDDLASAMEHVRGGGESIYDLTIADRPADEVSARIRDRWLGAWRRVAPIVRRAQRAERSP